MSGMAREIGAFAFTGPSYSDLPSFMKPAAKAEGVKTYARHGGDEFFERSDNYAFALAGIVAHTVVVAFDYPDYHGLGDEWQKIDYAEHGEGRSAESPRELLRWPIPRARPTGAMSRMPRSIGKPENSLRSIF